ncbi:Acetyltransferase (GNAT) [Gracilaria domingensis]|nr:Acetyltransferase (GNAT) [Gracilaria domingensis]
MFCSGMLQTIISSSRTTLRSFSHIASKPPIPVAAGTARTGTAGADSYSITSNLDHMAPVEKICIRRVEEADLQRGFFEVLSQLTAAPRLSSEQFGELVRAQIELDVQLTLVAVEGDRVLGTGSILIEPKFIRGGSPAGHIEDVVMHSSLRGKGVGKQIIERLVGHAKEKGCYKVVLDCGEYNVPFYEKCGLKQMGRQMAIYF